MESEFDLKKYLIENTLTPQSAGQLAYEKKDPDGVEVGNKEVKTGDRATKLATLQKALRQVEAKKNELVSKHKAGELPIEQYKQAIGDIPEKIKLLRGGIAKLERKLSLDETDDTQQEENIQEQETPGSMYLLNSNSKINTLNPEQNEYVDNDLTYILADFNGKKFIISGSGKSQNYHATPGARLNLFDDGNGTTRFAKSYDRRTQRRLINGTPAKIVAVADDIEGIKSFPKGNYSLYVMK